MVPKKTITVFLVLGSILIILSQCISGKAADDPRGKEYAGAGSCRQCHQAVHDSFTTTSHFNTTAWASAKTLQGNFGLPGNAYVYDSITKVVMQKRDSSFYQVLFTNGKEEKAYRFDIVFGGKHAQTSAYVNNGNLYELPVSYYHEKNGWAASPGYPANHPLFTRLIDTECLDCHSSNVSINPNTAISANFTMDMQKLLPGIDCERCHGPAKDHVDFHLDNPGIGTAAHLIKTKTLNRQQQLDACAICHSGNDKLKIQSRFEFQIGDTMGYFFMPFGNKKNEPDVHGNQYGLLSMSNCFKLSQMTCGTCHDPHKNATQDLAVYSNTCMSCHDPKEKEFCPEYARLGETIKSNCIDCHMPKQSSQSISFRMQQETMTSPYFLRTHKIGIYTDSSALQARKKLAAY